MNSTESEDVSPTSQPVAIAVVQSAAPVTTANHSFRKQPVFVQQLEQEKFQVGFFVELSI